MDLAALFGSLGASVVANTTIQGIVLITLADFVLGSLKALSNHTFQIKWLDAWVGDHFLKVVTILFGLVFGIVAPAITIGTVSLNLVGIGAEAAAVAYFAKTLASVVSNLNFGGGDAPPASVSPAP